MRAVLQRVTHAKVDVVAGEQCHTQGEIGHGLMVLLAVGEGDDDTDARYIADKIAHLRIFTDDEDKLNLSLLDVGGAVLLVSQFTLYGDARNGRRPSYGQAARSDQGQYYYQVVAQKLRAYGITVATGVFQTHMRIDLCNDGPVTLLLDSRKQF